MKSETHAELEYAAREQRMFSYALRHLGVATENPALVAAVIEAHYVSPAPDGELTVSEIYGSTACGLSNQEIVGLFRNLAKLYLNALDKRHAYTPQFSLDERVDLLGATFPYDDAREAGAL